MQSVLFTFFTVPASKYNSHRCLYPLLRPSVYIHRPKTASAGLMRTREGA